MELEVPTLVHTLLSMRNDWKLLANEHSENTFQELEDDSEVVKVEWCKSNTSKIVDACDWVMCGFVCIKEQTPKIHIQKRLDYMYIVSLTTYRRWLMPFVMNSEVLHIKVSTIILGMYMYISTLEFNWTCSSCGGIGGIVRIERRKINWRGGWVGYGLTWLQIWCACNKEKWGGDGRFARVCED